MDLPWRLLRRPDPNVAMTCREVLSNGRDEARQNSTASWVVDLPKTHPCPSRKRITDGCVQNGGFSFATLTDEHGKEKAGFVRLSSVLPELGDQFRFGLRFVEEYEL